MLAGALVLAASLSFAASSAASERRERSEGHAAPAPSMTDEPPRVQAPEKQALLAELWQRRILSAELDRWAPEDLVLLERVRAAEQAGAIGDLRRAFNGLKGYAVPRKGGSGSARGPRALVLTKEGFERWLFLRSQKAVEYFASKGVDPKWAFQLTDLEGRRVFESARGVLTPAGESLYARAKAGQEARWKTPDGMVGGNRRPKP